MRRKTLIRLFPGVATGFFLLATLCAPSARGEFVYTYTGKPFTSNTTGNSAIMEITVTLDFSAALPASETFTASVAGLDSWSISDGYDTFTNSSDKIAAIGFATIAGSIAEWELIFSTDGTKTAPLLETINDFFSQPTDEVDLGTGGSAFNTNSPGTWTETITSATPEPGTASLGLAAAALIACFCAAKAGIARHRSALKN